MFNAVIRLCMRDLLPCLLKMLNLKSEKEDHKLKLASTGENWKKLKAPIKSYLDDMLSVNINLFFL